MPISIARPPHRPQHARNSNSDDRSLLSSIYITDPSLKFDIIATTLVNHLSPPLLHKNSDNQNLTATAVDTNPSSDHQSYPYTHRIKIVPYTYRSIHTHTITVQPLHPNPNPNPNNDDPPEERNFRRCLPSRWLLEHRLLVVCLTVQKIVINLRRCTGWLISIGGPY